MVGICIQKQDGMVKKMTNEQAAEILEEVKIIDDGLGQYIPGFDEALDLAISKLKIEDGITKLMQEIFSKTLILENTAGELHEVIHTDDLKDIFREVMGWVI